MSKEDQAKKKKLQEENFKKQNYQWEGDAKANKIETIATQVNENKEVLTQGE